MPETPIGAGRAPIPTESRAEPLRAAARLPRSAAEPDPHVDAVHVGQGRLTRIGVPGSVPLAPVHFTPEGDDFRSAVPLLPPTLPPPALHPFQRFDRRHRKVRSVRSMGSCASDVDQASSSARVAPAFIRDRQLMTPLSKHTCGEV
jgi:hypothetical protein